MLVKEVIISFLKDHSDICIPIKDVALECGCTSAYVAKVVSKLKECKLETRKFGKRYVRYESNN